MHGSSIFNHFWFSVRTGYNFILDHSESFLVGQYLFPASSNPAAITSFMKFVPASRKACSSVLS